MTVVAWNRHHIIVWAVALDLSAATVVFFLASLSKHHGTCGPEKYSQVTVRPCKEGCSNHLLWTPWQRARCMISPRHYKMDYSSLWRRIRRSERSSAPILWWSFRKPEIKSLQNESSTRIRMGTYDITMLWCLWLYSPYFDDSQPSSLVNLLRSAIKRLGIVRYVAVDRILLRSNRRYIYIIIILTEARDISKYPTSNMVVGYSITNYSSGLEIILFDVPLCNCPLHIVRHFHGVAECQMTVYWTAVQEPPSASLRTHIHWPAEVKNLFWDLQITTEALWAFNVTNSDVWRLRTRRLASLSASFSSWESITLPRSHAPILGSRVFFVICWEVTRYVRC